MIFVDVSIALIVVRSFILSFSSHVRVGIGLSRDIVFISGAAPTSEIMWGHFSVGLGRSLGLGFRFEFDARRDRRSRSRLEFLVGAVSLHLQIFRRPFYVYLIV